jgi:hypothetical protein
MRATLPGCCAPAASGQVPTEQAIALMKSRRRMQPRHFRSGTRRLFEFAGLSHEVWIDLMSASGQKQTSSSKFSMSAPPPTTDIRQGYGQVPSQDVRHDSVSRSIRPRFSTHRHRPRRQPAAQGRAMSNNGCTFSPPLIWGFDGSKRSRSSRFLTSARATTKASFRLLACRSAALKKALPK